MQIMITGGSGTLGKAVTKLLLRRTGIEKIVIFSRDEASQVQMGSESDFKSPKVVYHIGDITDKDNLTMAIRTNKVTHIIHTAALKHVPIAEAQPSVAIETNVVGSHNVLKAALENQVKRVVLVSTDKAAQPSNVYGLSKALMEKLMNEFNGIGDLTVNVTRFGNLVGSRGSVLDLFIRQARLHKEVTVTDPSMTRFFIRIAQAASITLSALDATRSGLIFVPQMRSSVLENFVKAIFEYLHMPPNMKVIGLRAGEKRHELIISENEVPKTTLLPEFHGFVLNPLVVEKPALDAPLSSETAQKMDTDELVGMIQEIRNELSLA